MKTSRLFFALAVIGHFSLHAQVGGNAIYAPAINQRPAPATGDLATTEPRGSVPVAFIEANVLLNLKADAYRAVFALAQEGPTLADANEKMSKQASAFTAALKALGVKPSDIYVDFVSQNRIYDFDVQETVAREKSAGFEVKKNVVVRYHDAALLDQLLVAAAQSSIFDLVRVDYLVTDMAAARARLLEEASKVIKNKEAAYQRLLDVKIRRTWVSQEKYNANFPSDMYKSYTAFESGNLENYNLRVVRNRKTSTFYYSPLDPADFDAVLNPAGLEPLVHLTLDLKVRYVPAPDASGPAPK
jgi:uncharacterized protein YggE